MNHPRLIYCRRKVSALRKVRAQRLFVTGFVLTVNLSAMAGTIPLPRERPELIPGDRQLKAGSDAEPSPCQLRLADLAVFRRSPSITGPGECTASDVVTVNEVLLADEHRVVFSPSVTLRCPMAEAVAHWIRDDVAPTIATLGTSLRGIETLDCLTAAGVTGSVALGSASMAGPTPSMFASSNLQMVQPSS